MGIIQTTKTLRPRQKNDYYPTPRELCRVGVGLATTFSDNILDPGCGAGVWGQAARELHPHAWITGVDIEPQIGGGLVYNSVYEQDFLDDKFTSNAPFDLIVGNPPYILAEEFIRKSYKLLKLGGEIIFLLRLNFLEGQKRGKGLWSEFPPSEVWVLSKRPSFTGDRRTDATAYMLAKWRYRYSLTPRETELHWLDWDYDK